MHEQTGKLFLCASCQAQVLVCSQCDRGQRYCAAGCADITRFSLQREAGKRYQQGRAGRHKRASRMLQWRKRQAAATKIVTHHSSQATRADAVLANNESPPAIPPDSQPQSPCSPIVSESIALCTAAIFRTGLPAPVWHCHCCQSPCSALVRQGFLRHSRW